MYLKMEELDLCQELKDYFINNPKTLKYIKSQSEIEKILNKWMSISPLSIHKEKWTTVIPLEEVVLGLSVNEFGLIIGKDKSIIFDISKVSKTFSFNDFNKLEFVEEGWYSSKIKFDGNVLFKLHERSGRNVTNIKTLFDKTYEIVILKLEKQNSPEKNNSKSSLLIKTKVKDIFGSENVIELYDNRIVYINELSVDCVEYFDGDKYPLNEFSNMKIETDVLDKNNKPWLGLSANQIYDDGSGGQNLMNGFIFIDPSEKKKLEKIIFYFENFMDGVEIKDLDKVFLESEKSETNYIKNTLREFDKDNNGIIDLIEDKNEFQVLLKKHQKVVIEKGKEFNLNYTHNFIKVGNSLKEKRNNIQLIFDCMKQVENKEELNEFVKILEGEIHSYNLLLINSLNLIVSLIEDDQITFYDIYEKFDKLNIFNSNWENDMSHKLTNLNKGISELNSNIKGLMYEIRDMGDRVVSSIDDLSYITEESTKMLDNRLGEIDSSIKTNNLLTLINTYQTYKINKNTKV